MTRKIIAVLVAILAVVSWLSIFWTVAYAIEEWRGWWAFPAVLTVVVCQFLAAVICTVGAHWQWNWEEKK